MKDFFLDKFEFDFYSNKTWVEKIISNENKVNDFILKSMSHIINVHNIWNSRLLNVTQESDEWDNLPLDYLIKLNHVNYNTTINYLENIELLEKVNYHDSEGVLLKKNNIDVLYHILNHSNHHRAQISLEMRRLNIPVSTTNFIVFK